MKRSFFQAAVTSILLYGCTTWTLTKRLKKKLDGNYTRMLRAILNKPWRQHPTRHQLYGHLPPLTKTIQVRRTRHAGHCWRSRDELIRDVLLWTPTHGRAKAGRPARTCIQQLCEDTGCCPEDLSRAINYREEWRERVRDIRATSATWWWWWYIERVSLAYSGFCHPGGPQSENQRKGKEKLVLRSWKRSKKAVEDECDGNSNCNWPDRNGFQKLRKRTGRVGNHRTNRDHQDNGIVEIGQNTEKSPGDLRRIAFTQTPAKDHQLTFVWKLSKK